MQKANKQEQPKDLLPKHSHEKTISQRAVNVPTPWLWLAHYLPCVWRLPARWLFIPIISIMQAAVLPRLHRLVPLISHCDATSTSARSTHFTLCCYVYIGWFHSFHTVLLRLHRLVPLSSHCVPLISHCVPLISHCAHCGLP